MAAVAPVIAHAARAAAVLNFWFGDNLVDPKPNFELWYGGTPAIDADITAKFGADVEAAVAGKYNSWLQTPHEALALVVLLDQFSLNVYRDQPKGYDVSASAIPLSYTAIGRGFDQNMADSMRSFFWMPLMHSELLVDQDKCVEIYRKNNFDETGTGFAVTHRDIVAKYGRFPGRNVVHGRKSTPEEEKYLADGGVF